MKIRAVKICPPLFSMMLTSMAFIAGEASAQPAKAPQPASDAAEPDPIPVQCSLVARDTLFPVALRLQDGRIAAVVRSPANHLGIDGRLDIVFSDDEGKTWSKPALVVDTPLDDRDPAFGQAKDGTLVIGYYRDANYNEQGKYDRTLDRPHDTWVTFSSDGGKTWQQPMQIDVSDIGWGSPYGKIITLPDGAMLMPIYGLEVRPAGQKSP
ncbi:MAG: glycoside hydrolase, partial [Pseudomonadota bacterium]|nr:glycoside hydrolase [Pseudomonadota bacterium]